MPRTPVMPIRRLAAATVITLLAAVAGVLSNSSIAFGHEPAGEPPIGSLTVMNLPANRPLIDRPFFH